MTTIKNESLQLATFAGGCFWCMVQPFDTQPGIEEVVSGYIGGTVENPTYEQVKAGETGHVEAVQITFDPQLFPYERLLEVYWQQIDPTDEGGQFSSRGTSYETAVFYHNEEQKIKAEQSKIALSESNYFKQPIVTKIIEASTFYPAETYHQDYYKKNPEKYETFKEESGRASFIKEHQDQVEQIKIK